MKILIVDDEQQLRTMLKSFLTQTKSKHCIETAENGLEGWKKFTDAPDQYDLIITDVNMPKLDGLSLLEKLRRENFRIPVVMMTGYDDAEYTLKALRLGAIDFLKKPFEWDSLLESLTKLESLHSTNQQLKAVLPYQSAKVQCTIPSNTQIIQGVISSFQLHYQSYCELFKLDSNKIGLCLLEALVNGVIHGNLEVESSLKEDSWEAYRKLIAERESIPAYGDKEVIVSGLFKSNQLEFEVQDKGKGFDRSRIADPQDPSTLLSSGRGLLLIQSFMDEVHWNESGNRIKMVKYLKYN